MNAEPIIAQDEQPRKPGEPGWYDTDPPETTDDSDPLAGTDYDNLPLLPLVELPRRCRQCGHIGPDVHPYQYHKYGPEQSYCEDYRACERRRAA